MTCIFNWRSLCYNLLKPQYPVHEKNYRVNQNDSSNIAFEFVASVENIESFGLKCFGHTAHDWTNQMPEIMNCQSRDNPRKRPPASTIRCDDFQIKGRSFTRFNKTEGSILAPEVIIEVQWTNMWHGKCLDLRINKFRRPCRNYMLQGFYVGFGIVHVPM